MNFSSPGDSPGDSDGKPRHLFEDIFIILCIICLWPVVLGWTHIAYEFLLYGALLGLLVIFVRRIRRFRQARDELQN